MAGGDGLVRAREEVEAQLVADRQAELAELEQQPPLRRLGGGERRQPLRDRRPRGGCGCGRSSRTARRGRGRASCTPRSRRSHSAAARSGPRARARPGRTRARCRSAGTPSSRRTPDGRRWGRRRSARRRCSLGAHGCCPVTATRATLPACPAPTTPRPELFGLRLNNSGLARRAGRAGRCAKLVGALDRRASRVRAHRRRHLACACAMAACIRCTGASTRSATQTRRARAGSSGR